MGLKELNNLLCSSYWGSQFHMLYCDKLGEINWTIFIRFSVSLI